MSKSPRKTSVRTSASIVDGWLLFESEKKAHIDSERFPEILEARYTKAIRLVSLDSTWVSREYLPGVGSVNFSINLEMTLRAEIRSGKKYWYAYRRAGGKLQKRFVGQSEMVTTERLVKIAQLMV